MRKLPCTGMFLARGVETLDWSRPPSDHYAPLVQTVLIVLNVVLLAAVLLLGWRLARVRRQRKQRGLFGPWPIRRIPIEELAPDFRLDELGPTVDAEVRFIGRGSIAVPGGTSDAEAWILSVLAKRARLAFEFGTCTGKTAYLFARNMPPDGRVVTLTLPPDQLSAYRRDEGDSALDVANALDDPVWGAATDVTPKTAPRPMLGRCTSCKPVRASKADQSPIIVSTSVMPT